MIFLINSMKPLFTRKILNNGMIVLHEKRDIPVTTIALATKIGYGFEHAKIKGISHFIEHMAFKGTEKRTAEQISSELEKVGGELNAFTSDEITVFHVKLPSRHLKLGVDVLSDIFFNPLMKKEELEKERKVIIEEIKMYHDDPKRYVLDRIKELSYKAPFGLHGIGSVETLSNMEQEHLLEFHKKNYVASNTILCIVGNNSFNEIIELIKKIPVKEGKIKNNIVVKRVSEKVTEKRNNIQQSNIVISIPAPTLVDKKRYSAQLFAAILGEGLSSRLFREIREKRGLAYAVKAYLDAGINFGTIDFYVGTEKGKEEIVKNLILEEIQKMTNLSEKELIDAKQQLIGSYEVEEEDSRNTALKFIMEELCGDASHYYDFEHKIKAVKLNDVKEFSKIKDYSYVALVPED